MAVTSFCRFAFSFFGFQAFPGQLSFVLLFLQFSKHLFYQRVSRLCFAAGASLVFQGFLVARSHPHASGPKGPSVVI